MIIILCINILCTVFNIISSNLFLLVMYDTVNEHIHSLKKLRNNQHFMYCMTFRRLSAKRHNRLKAKTEI